MNEERAARFSFYTIVLMLFLCPLFFLPVPESYILPRKTLMELGAVLAAASLAAAGGLRLSRSPLFVPWLCFNLLFLLSVFRAPHLFMGWKAFVYFLALTTLAVIAPRAAAAAKRRRTLLLAVLAPGVINAVYGILQFNQIDFEFLKNDNFIVFGTLGTYGMMGSYMALCSMIALHFMVTARAAAGRLAAFISFILLVCALLMTFSRISLATCAGGIIVYFIITALGGGMSRRRLRLAAAAAAIVLVVAGAAVLRRGDTGYSVLDTSSGSFASRFFYSNKTESLLLHEIIWRCAAMMVAEKPLAGHGAGSFAYEYPLAQAELLSSGAAYEKYAGVAGNRIATYAHNGYLAVAAEGGLPALAALLLFPAAAFLAYVRAMKEGGGRRGGETPDYALYAAIVLMFGAQAVVDYAFYMPASALPAWLALGLLAGSGARASDSGARAGEGLLRRYAAPAAGAVLAAVVLLPLFSVCYVANARQMMLSREYSYAIDLLHLAKSLDPSNHTASYELGRIARYRGEFREAAGHFSASLEVSNNPQYYSALGNTYLAMPAQDAARGGAAARRATLGKAAGVFETLVAIDPSEISSRVGLAAVYFETGRAEEARRICEGILADDPDNRAAAGIIERIDTMRR